MAATIIDVENGMVEMFLAESTIADRIGRWLKKVACQEWIVLRESVQQAQSPRTGQWASFRRSGQQVGRLLSSAESKMRFAHFEIRTYGQVQEDAEALQEVFIAVIGAGVSGTWGTNPAVTIKNSHWLYEEQTSDYDESFLQAYAGIGLLVPYRSDL